MTTEERLEMLERELVETKHRSRRLLIGLALVVVGLGLVWTFAKITGNAHAQEDEKILRATAFVLVDDQGRVRGEMKMIASGPELRLADENGKARAELIACKDGPVLALSDENGKARVGLSVVKDGPGLVMLDENGKTRAFLNTAKNMPGLVMLDENGKVIWAALR